ncbi:MAG: Nif3-like dinuclear metal center hexameric protein [Desulfovibrionaceae bacterium]
MYVQDLIEFIETIAYPRAACEWDSSGVQIYSSKKNIETIAVMLDPTPQLVSKAVKMGADFILTHHPLLLEPQFLNSPSAFFDVTQMLLTSSTWLYAAHTSLDVNPNGPAGFLARELNADYVSIISPTYSDKKFLFIITESPLDSYASLSSLESFSLLFKSEKCLSFTVGMSHFSSVVDILKKYDVSYSHASLEGKSDISMGIGFVIHKSIGIQRKDLFSLLSRTCKKDVFSVSGALPNVFFTVGYCTGAGSSLIPLLDSHSLDIFITGEIKHHHAIETTVPLIDVGHHSMEEHMMKEMALLLMDNYSNNTIVFIDSADPFRLIHKDAY